jgi:hypothetical protein
MKTTKPGRVRLPTLATIVTVSESGRCREVPVGRALFDGRIVAMTRIRSRGQALSGSAAARPTRSLRQALSAIPIAAVAACVATTGCSGGSPTATHHAPTVQPSTGPAAQAAVKAMWQRFFNGAVPIPTRLRLLQDGQQVASFVRSQEQTTIGAFVLQATAKVASVTLEPPGKASVLFTVYLLNKPLAKNLHGTAVYSGSRWLVAVSSFCDLMRKAYGKTHPTFPAVCGG